MDITILFKACVKTVRTRNKAFGVQNDADKNRILKNKPKSPFLMKARDITSQITKLRDFLLENRNAYLHFSNFMNTQNDMSDLERDQIDSGSQRIINSCSHIIQDLKKECGKLSGTTQVLEFREAVIRILETYLKSVCAIQTEQKAIRVKRALDVRKLTKLEVDIKEKKPLERKNSNEIIDELFDNIYRTKENGTDREVSSTREKSSSHVAAELDLNIPYEDDQLSAEELQIFESENVQLFNELNSLSEEVKQIESKVLHIAELQEVFTEKVLQQDQDVDRIVGTVIGVNENVRDANEQIRQAIQRNAGLRVWVLFFLLVMSFSLLFLDWYNE